MFYYSTIINGCLIKTPSSITSLVLHSDGMNRLLQGSFITLFSSLCRFGINSSWIHVRIYEGAVGAPLRYLSREVVVEAQFPGDGPVGVVLHSVHLRVFD